MTSQSTASLSSRLPQKLAGWRLDAARLAGELLRSVSPQAADQVLDLRSALLDGGVSPMTLLGIFLAARNQLEQEHYLLFFRLRRVLEPNLGLKLGTGAGSKMISIEFHHRHPQQLLRRARQEIYEHDLTLDRPEDAVVTVTWRLAAAAEP